MSIESNSLPNLTIELAEMLTDFEESWENRSDTSLIVNEISDWIKGESDKSLAEILIKFFQDNRENSEIIPVEINQDNLDNIKTQIIDHIRENNLLKDKFNDFRNQITQDSSCAELVDILQKIWEQSNDESITVKPSDQEKIDKLIEIGLVKKDDKENPIPINWIYKKLFSLDDLAALLSASPTPGSPSIIQDPNPNTGRQTEYDTNTGLNPIVAGVIVVISILAFVVLFVRQCNPDNDRRGNESDGGSQTVNQECLTISNKLSLKDLSAGNSSNGDKDLIIKRDRAITGIENFLSQQPQKESLGEICGENYGTRYAELLYDQAIAVASQGYSPITSKIKYSQREDALCLIREKDIEGSKKYTFQQVKDRLKKWEATCPN